MIYKSKLKWVWIMIFKCFDFYTQIKNLEEKKNLVNYVWIININTNNPNCSIQKNKKKKLH
jgi:hypothetical protein